MDSHFYYILFGSIVLVVTFFSSIELLSTRGRLRLSVQANRLRVFLLISFVIGFIGFFPVGSDSDKERYLYLFDNIFSVSFDKDLGWVFYTYLSRVILKNATLFFLVTALLYTIGNYLFLRKIVPIQYLFYILLSTFGSLGYFGYGVNTIRAGIGLSFFLIAFTYRKKLVVFFLISVLAVFIHKSMIILLAAFLITQYVSKSKWFIGLWVFSLVFSILDISVIIDFIQSNFSGVDERVGSYLGTETSEVYNSGFRYDFLIYSIIPIVTGYYYLNKLKFNDITYLRLYNIYLVVNAFWLLVIRIPFTDRFAYLSWFLYPLLMLYPLFYARNIKNRNRKIALIMFGIVLFNFILLII